MKQPKEIQYHHLVSAARQVLLSIKIDNPNGYVEKDGKMILRSCQSELYLYGGRAPDNLKELFTYHHMHKIRKEWADRHVFKYFNIFFPSLTKKRMWKIITNRRKHYYEDLVKVDKRIDLKRSKTPTQVKVINKYTNKIIKDYMPIVKSNNYNRLFPLSSAGYATFIADKHDRFENNNYTLKFGETLELIIDGSGKEVCETIPKKTWALIEKPYIYPYHVRFEILMEPGKMTIIQGREKKYLIGSKYYLGNENKKE